MKFSDTELENKMTDKLTENAFDNDITALSEDDLAMVGGGGFWVVPVIVGALILGRAAHQASGPGRVTHGGSGGSSVGDPVAMQF